MSKLQMNDWVYASELSTQPLQVTGVIDQTIYLYLNGLEGEYFKVKCADGQYCYFFLE